MSYQVKVYNRSNAYLVQESPVMDSRKDADNYLVSVGTGEGYWSELVEVFDGYTITRLSTV